MRILSRSACLLVCTGLMLAVPEAARANRRGDTALGLGIGALGGALLSDGDTWGTIGGAVVGGVIARAASKDRKRDRWDRHRDRREWDRRHDRYRD